MSLRRALLFALFLGLTAPTPAARAMSVTPTQVEMTSTGRVSRASITVVNDGSDAPPVELVVKRATLDEAGTPATSAGETSSPRPLRVLSPPRPRAKPSR